MTSLSVLESFLEATIPEPNTACLLWLRGVDGKGRGAFSLGRNGVNVQAHRFAWMATFGPIPNGLCVCHTCDTPLCVNPDHLFIGTLSDNTQDMVRKGRHGARMRRVATFCRNGHPRTPDNISICRTDGAHRCKQCHRDSARKRQA